MTMPTNTSNEIPLQLTSGSVPSLSSDKVTMFDIQRFVSDGFFLIEYALLFEPHLVSNVQIPETAQFRCLSPKVLTEPELMVPLDVLYDRTRRRHAEQLKLFSRKI